MLNEHVKQEMDVRLTSIYYATLLVDRMEDRTVQTTYLIEF